jgi:tetratricopeptide (TPR) repeat protein
MPAYYTAPVVPVPIEPTQETVAAAALPLADSSEGITVFDQARAAFLKGQYDAAMKLTDTAIAQMPHDAVLHEFRALVLFALQHYAEAAAAIHAVLDVGPGWDWKTLSGLYPSVEVYTSQLRALEAAVGKEPKAAGLRFLLGYHYLSLGHQEKALDMLRQAAQLQPKDAVAAALAATLSPRDAQPAKASAAAAPKAIPAGHVAGTWTAGGKTAKYSMNLRKDGTFTWAFSRGSRKQEVKGVYTVEDNVLAMEPDTGGVMLAELTATGPDTLHFKMIGGTSDDQGLKFQRGQS